MPLTRSLQLIVSLLSNGVVSKFMRIKRPDNDESPFDFPLRLTNKGLLPKSHHQANPAVDLLTLVHPLVRTQKTQSCISWSLCKEPHAAQRLRHAAGAAGTCGDAVEIPPSGVQVLGASGHHGGSVPLRLAHHDRPGGPLVVGCQITTIFVKFTQTSKGRDKRGRLIIFPEVFSTQVALALPGQLLQGGSSNSCCRPAWRMLVDLCRLDPLATLVVAGI